MRTDTVPRAPARPCVHARAPKRDIVLLVDNFRVQAAMDASLSSAERYEKICVLGEGTFGKTLHDVT